MKRSGPVLMTSEMQRGFTLIETLLAMSILVMLIAIVLSAFRLGIRSWEKGEATADSTAARRAILSRLEKDAGSMYPYSQDAKAAKDGGARLFNGAEGSLGFVTVSRSFAKRVYYSVDAAGLTVTEKIVPVAEPDAAGSGRLIELAPGVNGARFEYLGPSGWKDNWDEGDENLPAAVRARFSFRDGSAFAAVFPIGAGGL